MTEDLEPENKKQYCRCGKELDEFAYKQGYGILGKCSIGCIILDHELRLNILEASK